MIKTNTIRFKISIVYVSIIGVFLVALHGYLYHDFLKAITRGFDERLQLKADEVGDAVNSYIEILGSGDDTFNVAARSAVTFSTEHSYYHDFASNIGPFSYDVFWDKGARKLGLGEDYLVILDAQNFVLAKSNNVPDSLMNAFTQFAVQANDMVTFTQIPFHDDYLRVITTPYFYGLNKKFKILVGTSYRPLFQLASRRRWSIFLSIPIILLLASFIARLFISRILEPVVEISRIARRISQENLNVRLKTTHADEEIRYLTESLNDMISRLEAAFVYIKDFSLLVAHELKTPIAIIRGEAELALDRDRDVAAYKKVIAVILEESKRMLKTVDDLLLVTKLDYQVQKVKFESLDLGAFLHEICEETDILASGKGINVLCDIPHGPIMINGDKSYLERLFFNLIENALKFTPKGGRIQVSSQVRDHKAVIAVKDTGAGIAKDDLPEIFQKFYRGKETGPEVPPGSGLGLSIVMSIVKLHQGQITAASELGKGTTFTIEFPLATEEISLLPPLPRINKN